MKPLEGLTVLEFCQYLAGPLAGLRLADLGARVVKIERPVKGEAGRGLAIKNLFVDGDSLLFHTINRNKESCAFDLKDAGDLERVKGLIARADVMTHNFRPGVMEKIGLDYPRVRSLNPRLIYGVVTGYGTEGPWADKPGQDLLIQSLSGLAWLSGNRDQGPVPFGLAVADMMCGNHLAQGILAALVQRGRTGDGALVEVSLMESILDFQFEVLTGFMNDGNRPAIRAAKGNAHVSLGAPYGIYATSDGYVAIAMGDLTTLARAIGCDRLTEYSESNAAYERRDEIMEVLAQHFQRQPTRHWLDRMEPLDIWCSDIFDYRRLFEHEAYRVLNMDQDVSRPGGTTLRTTRCPIRIDGKAIFSAKAAPRVGENDRIEQLACGGGPPAGTGRR